MILEDKIRNAQAIIVAVRDRYSNPIVYSSFGKDSMVLLDLIGKTGFKYPIIFHREPFCPAKYQFANQTIERNEYSVYDYPPSTCSMVKKDGYMEIVNWHKVGTKYISLPTGINANDKGKRICGLNDILKKPKCDYNFPWDICFVGRKSSDVDPIIGPMTLEYDIKVNPGSADYVYPLRHFTDSDIWEYTERFSIPYQEDRYDKDNGYCEFADKTYNPDYFPICVNCLDRDGPESVWCDYLKMMVNNISSEIPYSEPDNIQNGPPLPNRKT